MLARTILTFDTEGYSRAASATGAEILIQVEKKQARRDRCRAFGVAVLPIVAMHKFTFNYRLIPSIYTFA
jgi:hypothetical protein